jgi:hypothetical protein
MSVRRSPGRRRGRRGRRGEPDGRERRAERGSALVLMPAGVLVALILASIAVDMSVVHLRKRQALDLAAAAANDAATAGADPVELRAGEFRLDAATVRQVVLRSVAASDLAPDLVADPTVTVTATEVEVMLAVEADYVFGGAIPGAPDGAVVTATATASAASGA